MNTTGNVDKQEADTSLSSTCLVTARSLKVEKSQFASHWL